MEDLETLKVIKEKEQSINGKISALKGEKEKQLQELESTFSRKLKDNEEKLASEAASQMEKTTKEATARADRILEESKAKAGKLKLKVSDKELEKISTEILNQYLEGT